MRLLALAAVLALTACGFAGRGGANPKSESVDVSVQVRPDSLLRAAINYLGANGYTTNRLADSTLVTSPRPVPERARTNSTQDQQWILQIKTEKMFLMSGSRLRVIGFVLPSGASTPVDTTTVRQATPITGSNARLFGEVRSVANAIARSVSKK